MKLSAWVFLTDLVPEKQTTVDKLVKTNIFKENGHHNVLSSLKRSGIDSIELLIPTVVSSDDLFTVKTILQKNKMSVLSIHQPLDFFFNTTIKVIKRLFEVSAYFSANVIVLHISTTGNQIFNKHYIDTLRTLEKKYNIRIGFENSQRYLFTLFKQYTWNPDTFSLLMQKTGFHMTLDTAHMGQVGGNIIDFFRENKTSIVNIHISDYKNHAFSSSFRPLDLIHLPIGEGDLPLKTLLQILKKHNYQGIVTMEINADLEGLCKSARVIRTYID